MSNEYICITPVVTDLSGISSTKLIVGSTYIGHLDSFGVSVYSSATQVIAYRIQFSPYDGSYFATAGTNQTATSAPVGSGGAIPVVNTFMNNINGYMRIEASGACSIVNTPIMVAIHGRKR